MKHIQSLYIAGLLIYASSIISGCTISNEPDPTLPKTSTSPKYSLGSPIDFAKNGNSMCYLASGWSGPEIWGTWTDGAEAKLILQFEKLPNSDLCLTAKLNGFVTKEHPQCDVDVLVNGTKLTRWTFKLTKPEIEQRIVIPIAIAKQKQPMEIAFMIHDPHSPKEVGLSGDVRQLGLGVKSMCITPIKDAAH